MRFFYLSVNTADDDDTYVCGVVMKDSEGNRLFLSAEERHNIAATISQVLINMKDESIEQRNAYLESVRMECLEKIYRQNNDGRSLKDDHPELYPDC